MPGYTGAEHQASRDPQPAPFTLSATEGPGVALVSPTGVVQCLPPGKYYGPFPPGSESPLRFRGSAGRDDGMPSGLWARGGRAPPCSELVGSSPSHRFGKGSPSGLVASQGSPPSDRRRSIRSGRDDTTETSLPPFTARSASPLLLRVQSREPGGASPLAECATMPQQGQATEFQVPEVRGGSRQRSDHTPGGNRDRNQPVEPSPRDNAWSSYPGPSARHPSPVAAAYLRLDRVPDVVGLPELSPYKAFLRRVNRMSLQNSLEARRPAGPGDKVQFVGGHRLPRQGVSWPGGGAALHPGAVGRVEFVEEVSPGIVACACRFPGLHDKGLLLAAEDLRTLR
ncbi:hypothetical protein DIPPA_06076 [Diplonema papillatum]|nr:hypothetical protein DIPPA_06076 [Diplonema papillatum]